MNQVEVVRNLDRLRRRAEARRKHYVQAQAVKGELESKRAEGALQDLDREVQFLETLASAVEGMDLRTAAATFAEVEGGGISALVRS